jgi:hypothetical protein
MSVRRNVPNIPILFVNQNFKIPKIPTQQQHMAVLILHWPNPLTNSELLATENSGGRATRFSLRVKPFHNAEA